MKQAITLMIAMSLGILFPSLAFLKEYLPFIIGIMMFFSFCLSSFSFSTLLQKDVWKIVGAMMIVSCTVFLGLYYIQPTLAIIAFLIATIPTAAAAPTMVMVFKGNVAFAVSVVVATHVGMAFFISLVAPFIAPHITATPWQMLSHIFLLLVPPFLIAKSIRYFFPFCLPVIDRYKEIGFYAWTILIISGVAQSSSYLYAHPDQIFIVVPIIILAFALCIFHFWIGKKLSQEYSQEASQCYGQRNVGFTIWLALTFLGPLYALGPSSYIFAQHAVNIYKLIRKQ